jgi:hypothetical protein
VLEEGGGEVGLDEAGDVAIAFPRAGEKGLEPALDGLIEGRLLGAVALETGSGRDGRTGKELREWWLCGYATMAMGFECPNRNARSTRKSPFETGDIRPRSHSRGRAVTSVGSALGR